MSTELVLLAALMGLVTYPFRVVPLLAPGFERLPPRLRTYLRLVGPAVLAALAVTSTMVMPGDDGRPSFYIGPEWLAVGACIAVVAMRRSLLIGLILAAGSIAILRAIGVAPLP